MTKKRFNLRKVATIVACLVVTMMFAACDKTNPDDDNGNGSGNIDKKLVGHWQLKTSQTFYGSTYQVSYDYYFKADGKFQYFFTGFSQEKQDGKYTVSNSKVYFTDVTLYFCSNDMQISNISKYGTDFPKYVFDGDTDERNDMITEYQFGTDKNGSYLEINFLMSTNDPTDVWTLPAYKFYKVP